MKSFRLFHVKTNKQNVGQIGEDLATEYLQNKNFTIVDRNYHKKWGEIDIVAEKDGVIHFVEVKAITSKGDYMPEDNVRAWKKLRLSRVIRTYLMDKRVSEDKEFEVDIIAVSLDLETKKANIRMLENVNL